MNRSPRPYRFSCYQSQEHMRLQQPTQGNPYYVGNDNEGLRLGQVVLAAPPVGGMEAYVRYLSAARDPAEAVSVRARFRHPFAMGALTLLAGMLVFSDGVDGHEDLTAGDIIAARHGSAAASPPISTISTTKH
ncbi:hypothetical protein [uncultured Hyphomicrobium sp.]|uniref:hypothetical protein n=1 Tax=uncultured Hyphomicrobium sp. TaxID=194373 RepID=UPI0025CB9AAD|nr:hypothetical protein [uncultured Hyphomicrobium sp.]